MLKQFAIEYTIDCVETEKTRRQYVICDKWHGICKNFSFSLPYTQTHQLKLRWQSISQGKLSVLRHSEHHNNSLWTFCVYILYDYVHTHINHAKNSERARGAAAAAVGGIPSEWSSRMQHSKRACIRLYLEGGILSFFFMELNYLIGNWVAARE